MKSLFLYSSNLWYLVLICLDQISQASLIDEPYYIINSKLIPSSIDKALPKTPTPHVPYKLLEVLKFETDIKLFNGEITNA